MAAMAKCTVNVQPGTSTSKTTTNSNIRVHHVQRIQSSQGGTYANALNRSVVPVGPIVDPFHGLTREHAIQCKIIENASVEDYVLATADVIGGENIIAAAKSDRMFKLFLKSKDLVHTVLASGLNINGHYIDVNPLSASASKVTVSGVPPFLPNPLIKLSLSPFGTVLSPIRYIPLGCKNQQIKHVKSFRRNTLMRLDPDKTLPSHINIPYEGSTFKVYLSTDDQKLKCSNCNRLGHATSECKLPKAASSSDATTSSNLPNNASQELSNHTSTNTHAFHAEDTSTLVSNIATASSANTFPGGSQLTQNTERADDQPFTQITSAADRTLTESQLPQTAEGEVDLFSSQAMTSTVYTDSQQSSLYSESLNKSQSNESDMEEDSWASVTSDNKPKRSHPSSNISDESDFESSQYDTKKTRKKQLKIFTPSQQTSLYLKSEIPLLLKELKSQKRISEKCDQLSIDKEKLLNSLKEYSATTKLSQNENRQVKRIILTLSTE